MPDIQVIGLREERRHPVQKEPQNPAMAEAHDSSRPERAYKRPPAHRYARLADLYGEASNVFRGNARMIGGVVAVIPDPQDDPRKTRRTEHDERDVPRKRGDQAGDENRRRRVAKPGARVRDAL